MSHWRLIALAVYALAGAVCGLWCTLIMTRMVSMVNDRLPQDQRFAPNWWHYSKRRRLAQAYRRLYPAGPHLRQLRTVTILMGLAFLAASIALLT